MDSNTVRSQFSGKDGGEVRLLPHQLPHQSACIREGFQGDTVFCRQQRDGTNHAKERSGNACSQYIDLYSIAVFRTAMIYSIFRSACKLSTWLYVLCWEVLFSLHLSDCGEEGRRERWVLEGQHWTKTGLLPRWSAGGDYCYIKATECNETGCCTL